MAANRTAQRRIETYERVNAFLSRERAAGWPTVALYDVEVPTGKITKIGRGAGRSNTLVHERQEIAGWLIPGAGFSADSYESSGSDVFLCSDGRFCYRSRDILGSMLPRSSFVREVSSRDIEALNRFLDQHLGN